VLLKRIVMVLMLCLCLSGSISMATTNLNTRLSSDDIVIAEPMTERVLSDKPLYLTVNIVDASYYERLADEPLHIQLIKFEDTLPFAAALGDELDVPVVKLSASAAMEWLDSEGAGDELPLTVNDDLYSDETEIINQFFLQLDRMNALKLKIEEALNKYKFNTTTVVLNSSSEVSQEEQAAYYNYLSDKDELYEMERSFSEVQAKYLKLFEVNYFEDQIASPSFLKDIGTLPLGNYRIRIYDYTGDVVKTFSFKVISSEKTLDTILTDPISGEEKTKN